ncbi:hypothetical protein CC86DRAFT_39162 [Ophiobolus disseminans]|uniref:Uncharacterized protein n=1 Tax=Ophiobolus disseminans TaxID=1469910 RepID=A0A6A6ZWL7_9PLEO|nr:hypothetical protein CC86DRAFT_39162 [Ophiobolus disseminans]
MAAVTPNLRRIVPLGSCITCQFRLRCAIISHHQQQFSLANPGIVPRPRVRRSTTCCCTPRHYRECDVSVPGCAVLQPHGLLRTICKTHKLSTLRSTPASSTNKHEAPFRQLPAKFRIAPKQKPCFEMVRVEFAIVRSYPVDSTSQRNNTGQIACCSLCTQQLQGLSFVYIFQAFLQSLNGVTACQVGLWPFIPLAQIVRYSNTS